MYILFFLLFLLIFYFWKQKKFYWLHWKLKGELGLPFLGTVFKLSNQYKILGYLSILEKTYTSPYVIWLGPRCTVIVNDPDTVESILTSKYCINKSFVYEFLTDLIGNGLFSSTVPLWFSRVKTMKPAFKRKIILSFYSTFNRSSKELNTIIETNENNKEFSFFHTLQLVCLKATFQTTLGEDFQETSRINFNSMLKIFTSLMSAMIERIFKPWLYNSAIYLKSSHYNDLMKKLEPLIDFLDSKIKAKAEEMKKTLQETKSLLSFEEENKPYDNPESFIDFILKVNHNMTLKHIRDEIIVLIGAGFETTAVALYITILCLAMHPDEQERLFDELVIVFPHKDFEINEENVKSDLNFTEMCINEALRVISPTPLVGRTNSKEITLPNGVTIPKGTDILLDIFNLQRSHKNWGPNSKKFNPDNFSSENIKNHHAYSYIPFTKGHRMCIGFKYSITFMKIFLARLFREYRVYSDMKFEDLEYVENISMKFKKHPRLIFERRT